MRQFEEQTKKVKEVTSIVCNKCGRVIPVDRRGSPGRCAEQWTSDGDIFLTKITG